MSWGRPYDAGTITVAGMEEKIAAYPDATITPRRRRAVAEARSAGHTHIRTIVEHDGALTAVTYEPCTPLNP